MTIDPEVPVIVEAPDPGSAGEALNAYADTLVAAWAASVNAAERDEGIHSRDVELESYDDLVDGLEAEAARLIGLGLDLTVDPLP
jgi:hypothetical protein